MPRTMYDSVTPSAIPRSAAMVAGYLPPSRYAWSAAEWAMFPNAVKVRIAIFADVNDGHVLDVEPGDATPAQAPGWVAMRRRAGVDPSVYCNASTWPTVRAEFRRRGIREPHYWIAKYDNVARLPAGAVAKQYANPPLHGRGHFDLSVVADYWPGVEEDVMTPHQYRVLVETQRRVSRTYAVVVENQRRITAGQAALLAAINADDTSADAMTRIIDDSVAEHMPSSDEVVAAQRMLLADVVREVVPGDQADRIVEKLAEKLGEIGGGTEVDLENEVEGDTERD